MALLNRFKERLTAQNVFLDENTGGKGKYFKARFLQPGLVKYSFGVCVLEKDTIDKFINEFVGCPVIVGHKDVTNENAKDLSCGNICHIWYDEADGWYWGDGIIDNEEAIQKINEGYNVSCQYEITEYSNNTTNALHNGNPYDKVILNGKPEHLAIVDRPRYENAMIAMNALDLTAENEEKWITIHPNGEDGKGRPLLIKDGETVKEAVERKIVEWDKLPRETQSALKRLDFDNKINLEQYSGSEMSIAVIDKKIFDNLKKHKQDKASNSITNTIKQAINEIKETDMFKKLFNRKDNQMEKDEMKSLFIECLQECLKAKNEEDEKDEEDKKEEEKEAENKCKNEAVDKRDIIRQIMAIAGKEEASEDVKTIAKLAEKLAYDKSEADDKADNCKGKNEEEDKKEDEEKKEEAKNKAKNAIDEMKALFSQSEVKKAASSYVSRDDAIALGNELF